MVFGMVDVIFDDGVLILYGCTSKTQKVCVGFAACVS